MTHTLRNIAAAGAAILTLAGATAMQANAAYLGYGNGDSGNWSLWQEQNGGQSATKPTHRVAGRYQHHSARPAPKPAQPAPPAQTHYQNEKS
jgi:hypothetical protein